MRCRVNEVKCNYRTKYKNNITCSLCDSNSEESEVHLLQCVSIISEPDVKDSIPQMEYSYIFAEVKKQIKAVKTWRKFFKIRNWKNKIEHCPVMDARRTSWVPRVQTVALWLWTLLPWVVADPLLCRLCYWMYMTLDINIFTTKNLLLCGKCQIT